MRVVCFAFHFVWGGRGGGVQRLPTPPPPQNKQRNFKKQTKQQQKNEEERIYRWMAERNCPTPFSSDPSRKVCMSADDAVPLLNYEDPAYQKNYKNQQIDPIWFGHPPESTRMVAGYWFMALDINGCPQRVHPLEAHVCVEVEGHDE